MRSSVFSFVIHEKVTKVSLFTNNSYHTVDKELLFLSLPLVSVFALKLTACYSILFKDATTK